MIKRELAKDPKLAEESWDRFLPKFKKRNVKSKKPSASTSTAAANGSGPGPSGSNSLPLSTTPGSAPAPAPPQQKKKTYTPFPPAQQPSKLDLQMDSGEYFLQPHEKAAGERRRREERQREKQTEREKKRGQMFEVPSGDLKAEGVGEGKKEKREKKSRKEGGE